MAAAEARVPQKRTLGQGDKLSIASVRREGGQPRPQIIVDLSAPKGSKIDLFVEGPTSQWALPLPSPIDGAPPGQQRFVFELDGMPPGARERGAPLTMTAVAAGEAIEVTIPID